MAMGVSGDVWVAWQTRRKKEIHMDEEKRVIHSKHPHNVAVFCFKHMWTTDSSSFSYPSLRPNTSNFSPRPKALRKENVLI